MNPILLAMTIFVVAINPAGAQVAKPALTAAIACKDLFRDVPLLIFTSDLPLALRTITAEKAAVVSSPIHFSKAEVDSVAATLSSGDLNGNAMVIRLKDGRAQSWSDMQNFSEAVRTKIERFTVQMIHQFEVARGKPAITGSIIMRVTSDGSDTKIEGFHNHRRLQPGAVDFVWTLKGAGTRLLVDDKVIQAPTGMIVLFGESVMHGSPDSDEQRVLILGEFEP